MWPLEIYKWRTADEKSFIRGLKNRRFSRHATKGLNVPISSLQLLENYIKAAEARVVWGEIDAIEVIALATRELINLKKFRHKYGLNPARPQDNGDEWGPSARG